MRGQWNDFHALFCKECPCAYYTHCFAHHAQHIVVVASSRQVKLVHQFCEMLNFVINVVTSSSKHNDEQRDV